MENKVENIVEGKSSCSTTGTNGKKNSNNSQTPKKKNSIQLLTGLIGSRLYRGGRHSFRHDLIEQLRTFHKQHTSVESWKWQTVTTTKGETYLDLCV